MLAYKTILKNAENAHGGTYFMFSRTITPLNKYSINKSSLIKNKIDMQQLVIDGTLPVEGITYLTKELYKNDEANKKAKRTTSYIEIVKELLNMFYYKAEILFEKESYTIDCIFYEIPVIYQIPSILLNSIAIKNIIIRHMEKCELERFTLNFNFRKYVTFIF